MRGRFRRRLTRARRRPKTAALGVLLLAAAAGVGAWAASHGPAPEHAELTSYVAPARPRPAAPPAPAELQARLETLVAAYKEPVGVAVTDVARGWTAQVDGLAVYPQQSVVKLWVALAVMEAIDRGRLTLDQAVMLRPQDRSVFYQPLGSKI